MIGPLVVLWEDPHGLAVSKAAGMLTQGESTAGVTVEAMVRRHLRPDDPSAVYLGTVHRLDRPVSGVVLWAKNPKASRRWAQQFARREARKEYWAIVEGNASRLGSSGGWQDWLAPPDRLGRARVVEAGVDGAQRASTRFEVVEGRGALEGCTRVRLWPESGRTHQLRSQAASRGLPIVGDSTYGSRRAFPVGIALHARSLTVRHPIAGGPIHVEAPLPGSWGGWWD